MMAHKLVIVQGFGRKQFLKAFGAGYALWLNLRGRRRGLRGAKQKSQTVAGLSDCLYGCLDSTVFTGAGAWPIFSTKTICPMN